MLVVLHLNVKLHFSNTVFWCHLHLAFASCKVSTNITHHTNWTKKTTSKWNNIRHVQQISWYYQNYAHCAFGHVIIASLPNHSHNIVYNIDDVVTNHSHNIVNNIDDIKPIDGLHMTSLAAILDDKQWDKCSRVLRTTLGLWQPFTRARFIKDGGHWCKGIQCMTQHTFYYEEP